MASIFFTERLPAFRDQNCNLFARLRMMRGLFEPLIPDPDKIPAAEGTELSTTNPKRLPRKQGLCQIVSLPEFKALSDR
jgi:hypothetical protein